jgi:hypothetical protein
MPESRARTSAAQLSGDKPMKIPFDAASHGLAGVSARVPRLAPRLLPRLAAVASAVTLAACASNNPPAAPALAAGAASYEAARTAGAPQYAAGEMDNARSKLERARALAAAGNVREAVRLAEQADVDAQLASARTRSERSRLALAEVQASLTTLRQELQRQSANPAAPAALPMPVSPGTPPARP